MTTDLSNLTTQQLLAEIERRKVLRRQQFDIDQTLLKDMLRYASAGPAGAAVLRIAGTADNLRNYLDDDDYVLSISFHYRHGDERYLELGE